MIVSMIPEFSTLMKQHISKILKTSGILLFLNRSIRRILIIFNNHTGIANVVIRCKLLHIRPPHIHIEITNAHSIVPLHISTISLRNRWRKVIQIKYWSIDHRINPHISKETVGSRIESTHRFLIQSKVVYYKLPFSILVLPNDRLTVFSIDTRINLRILTQLHCPGRVIRIRDCISLSAAKHKFRFKINTVYTYIVISGRNDSKLLLNHWWIRCFLKCQSKKYIPTLWHPITQFHKILFQRTYIAQ